MHVCMYNYMLLKLCFPGPSDDSNNFTHELRGIIPRSFEYLFSLINREKQKASTDLASGVDYERDLSHLLLFVCVLFNN